jgi:drug/metabolite transporter (DMT)-like permease
MPEGPPTTTAPVLTAERLGYGIGCMLVSVAGFSALDAMGKWIVAALPVLQMAAIRGVCVLALAAPMVQRAGGLRVLHTRRPWAHVMRVVLGLIAFICFFESLRDLPLATTVAIGFAAPLFMTAGSTFLLGERVGIHRWSAVVIGFIGVLVITRPDSDDLVSWPAILAVIASLFFGLSQITVRWLTRTETDASMLVYQNLGMTLAGTCALPFVWVTPSWEILALILVSAGALFVGQMFSIRAFRHAPVAVVAPFQYAELLGATVFGYLIWGDFPSSHVWLGAAIVVGSGIYITLRETRRAKVNKPL